MLKQHIQLIQDSMHGFQNFSSGTGPTDTWPWISMDAQGFWVLADQDSSPWGIWRSILQKALSICTWQLRPGFLLRNSEPSLGACVCPYTHIVMYRLGQYTPINSQVFFSGRNCYSQNFNGERCHFLQYIVKFHSNIAGICYQHFITYTNIYIYISSTYIFYFPGAVKVSYFPWRQ